MRIDKTTARLSEHKKSIKLCSDQWGCDKPICRVNGESPTFGAMVLLFFLDRGKGQTMMVFGKPLRACEILKVWSQHHGIEQFWRHLKTDLNLSAMSLEGRQGAYANLGVKVINYPMLQRVKCWTRHTFHQGQLELSGQRQTLFEISAHFHEHNIG